MLTPWLDRLAVWRPESGRFEPGYDVGTELSSLQAEQVVAELLRARHRIDTLSWNTVCDQLDLVDREIDRLALCVAVLRDVGASQASRHLGEAAALAAAVARQCLFDLMRQEE